MGRRGWSDGLVTTTRPGVDGRGLGYGIGAHVLWGFFPAFWPLLDPATPIEVLAHRILWTLVLMAAVLPLVRGWRDLRGLAVRGWVKVTAAALCIAGNWGPVHLRGGRRSGGRGRARLLHEPAVQRAVRGAGAAGTAPARAVGGAGHRRRRGAGDQHRERSGCRGSGSGSACRSRCTACSRRRCRCRPSPG